MMITENDPKKKTGTDEIILDCTIDNVQISPDFIELMKEKKTKEKFVDQIGEWKRRSENGEVCGILGCEDKPAIHCQNCGNWYCKDHSTIHFHGSM